jgi:heme/copper-type cytochrome/quinol oxidase subunit 1
MVRVLQLAAVILTALALVPGGTHLFELPHKIGLPQEQYFIVQSLYRGWSLFGAVIIAAIIANLALALMLWRRDRQFWPSFAAGLILAGTLAIFFEWTYPANQATNNWTMMPPDWDALRSQWEWSHAANAVLTFMALCCTSLSAVLLRD